MFEQCIHILLEVLTSYLNQSLGKGPIGMSAQEILGWCPLKAFIQGFGIVAAIFAF